MDAGLKGITGDLFATLATTSPPAPAKPVRARPAPSKPAVTAPAKLPPTAFEQTQTTPPPAKAVVPRSARAPTPERKLPAYFYRLPLRAQRRYLASDSIDRFPLTASSAALTMVDNLMSALDGGAPSIVQRASQALLNEVCRLLSVRPVRLEVRSVRPHNSRGELHGLFYPQAPAARGATAGAPLIVLWMRTAQRHDVVKPRTFLRTLMHELGHYLDYALLKLEDSYHSGGFYQRESFLVRTLCPAAAPPPRTRK